MKAGRIRHIFPTIRSRLIGVLAACVLLPLVAGQIAIGLVTQRSVERSEVGKYRALSTAAARQVETSMDFAERNLRSLATNPMIVGEHADDLGRMREMERMAKTTRIYTDVSLYDASGLLIRSSSDDPANPNDPMEHTLWFREAAKGAKGVATISPPQPVMGRDRLDISVYFGVESGNGKRRQVVKGRVPFEPVWDMTVRNTFGEGYMVLVDGRNNIIAHPTRDKVYDKYSGPGVQPGVAEGEGEYTDDEGEQWIWVSQRIDPKDTHVKEPWTLIAMIPRPQILAAARQSSLVHLAGGMATFISAAFLGMWFSQRLSDPLVVASHAADRLAEGDVSTRLDEGAGPLEIRSLASAFNHMAAEVGQKRSEMEDLVKARTASLLESQRQAETLSAEFQAAFECTQEGFLIINADGAVLAANRPLARFFGFPADQLNGSDWQRWERKFFDCFKESRDFEAFWRRGGSPADAEGDQMWEISSPHRRMVTTYSAPVVAASGERLGVLWAFRDLTRQQELQENLEQAQKMEAIGRLAGGVAHDFNNLLTGIIGNLSLAEMQLALHDEEADLSTPREHVQHARSAAERAGHLVRGLLGFSRRSHLQLAHCRLNDVVKNFLPFIKRVIDPKITVQLDLDPSLWAVKADSGKIEQVLMNFCVNARDAIGGQGTITIRTRRETISVEVARRFRAEPGDYVCLSVTDTGSGIPPEVMDKIFEPFFTTKEQGKGTGLGLATSYGIVQQHGGWVSCESMVGHGTVFAVFLPRNDEAEPLPVVVSQEKEHRGTETILIVDDEMVVRTVAETLLKSNGYRVLTASDGREGVERFRAHQSDIHLVLMDMTMPRLSGTEAFREIRELGSDVPVVICSGYVVDLVEFETADGQRPNGFVQKPYRLPDLLETIRQCLDGMPVRRNQRPENLRPALSV